MSMWKINRQETEATSTNLVNINNKKVEFATKNNQIFCTSLDIARVFEKRHTHILDIIKNYLNDEDMKEFNQPNFRLVNYKDLKGELRPAYEVSRDGFSFIAMGLTGKKQINGKFLLLMPLIKWSKLSRKKYIVLINILQK
ncbi:Rha family transcriptional regulator [Campylobacter jejuni]